MKYLSQFFGFLRGFRRRAKSAAAGVIVEADGLGREVDLARKYPGIFGPDRIGQSSVVLDPEKETIAHHYNCSALPGGQVFPTTPVPPCTCQTVHQMQIDMCKCLGAERAVQQ